MDSMHDQGRDLQYLEAYNSLRVGKNCFWLLLLLAMAINLGTFIAVRFWPVLRGSPSFQTQLAELRVVSQATPSTQPAPLANSEASERFYLALGVLLPLARSIGLACALLLVLSLLLSLKVSLLGRLGGVGHLTSAMLWGLILMVLMVPWNTAFPGIGVPGVLFSRAGLITATAEVTWEAAGVTWADHVLYFVRFAAYPLVTGLIWLVVQLKYVRAFGQATTEEAPGPIAL